MQHLCGPGGRMGSTGDYRPDMCASNNRYGEYSAFQVGRFMRDQLRLKAHLLLKALLANCEIPESNWG